MRKQNVFQQYKNDWIVLAIIIAGFILFKYII